MSARSIMTGLATGLALVVLGIQCQGNGKVPDNFPLTRMGKPACRIVAITGDEPGLLVMRGIEAITGTVRRWGGVELPVVVLKEGGRELPAGPAIVLTTLDRLRKVVPDIETSNSAAMRVGFGDEHGFACVPVESGGVRRIFIVGRSPRGVFNGAVYLRDFLIDGERENLYAQPESVVRSPQMGGRGVYLLTIWGNEDEYSVEDWMKVFDSFARDGMDRVYFWLSGHFPSKKFTQTYKVADKTQGVIYDSTTESRIGNVEDQRRLIRYAHERGLRFYLGGGLGGWVGTLFLTSLDPETFKKNSVGDAGVDQSDESLCPSQPRVRRALVDYYKEIFDALPEADGLYVESADEMGACQCDLCNRAIDKFGSKQFGQAQLSLIQEIMRAVWQNHPQARLAFSVGFKTHQNDPTFYDVLRQMNDPRFEWPEMRDTWEFPGPEGKPLPAPYFSRQMLAWRYHDTKPLEQLVSDFNRMAKEGWYGAVSTFSPGFSSGSFYKQIPFPTDRLPYVLTHFLHREATWEPAMTLEEARHRVQRRFFGKEASEELGRDLWELREAVRTLSASAWGVTPSRVWGYIGCRQVSQEVEERINRIIEHIHQARMGASPKTLEGLELMTQAIDDIRKSCNRAIP